MKTNEFTYKVMDLNTAQLEIPRETYQRELSPDRVRRIVKAFDERIANEPKVSYRGGHYYVFDGQHTIAARVERNGGKPLAILCKVYLGLSESDEATLFAEQNGFSAELTAGARNGSPASAPPSRLFRSLVRNGIWRCCRSSWMPGTERRIHSEERTCKGYPLSWIFTMMNMTRSG